MKVKVKFYWQLLLKIRSYVLVSLVSFAVGALLVYFYNLNWIRSVQSNTIKLTRNFQDTYDIQQRLAVNYSEAYNGLVQCVVIEKGICNYDQAAEKLQQLKIERDELKVKLDKANMETQKILSGSSR